MVLVRFLFCFGGSEVGLPRSAMLPVLLIAGVEEIGSVVESRRTGASDDAPFEIPSISMAAAPCADELSIIIDMLAPGGRLPVARAY